MLKNRDRYILKRNEYDILVAMNKRLVYDSPIATCCVLDSIQGRTECLAETCEQCIQDWLNEEA